MPTAGCWCRAASMCTHVSRCLTEAWCPLMTSTRAPRLHWVEEPPWSVSYTEERSESFWVLSVSESKLCLWWALIENFLMRAGRVPDLFVTEPKYKTVHLLRALRATRSWLLFTLRQLISLWTHTYWRLDIVILHTLYGCFYSYRLIIHLHCRPVFSCAVNLFSLSLFRFPLTGQSSDDSQVNYYRIIIFQVKEY